jgi:hypothetical protein
MANLGKSGFRKTLTLTKKFDRAFYPYINKPPKGNLMLGKIHLNLV